MNLRNLRRHVEEQHERKTYTCEYCGSEKVFRRKDNLRAHVKKYHGDVVNG